MFGLILYVPLVYEDFRRGLAATQLRIIFLMPFAKITRIIAYFDQSLHKCDKLSHK
jgi:hypothetical protein